MLNRHQRNIAPSPYDFISVAYCGRIGNSDGSWERLSGAGRASVGVAQ